MTTKRIEKPKKKPDKKEYEFTPVVYNEDWCNGFNVGFNKSHDLWQPYFDYVLEPIRELDKKWGKHFNSDCYYKVRVDMYESIKNTLKRAERENDYV